MRSGPCSRLTESENAGIISACAERTLRCTGPRRRCGDHLRVCGADVVEYAVLEYEPGSSPRVRSGRSSVGMRATRGGIISACAERTTPGTCRPSRRWDYLRVCGADGVGQAERLVAQGLSPRVRSGLAHVGPELAVGGIISACAERTCKPPSPKRKAWDYLRVCGADPPRGTRYFLTGGLSPRVRSGQQDRAHIALPKGIISACAERTRWPRSSRCPTRDYLRVCGADAAIAWDAWAFGGLSPRVRSGHETASHQGLRRRIISACAERTRESGRRGAEKRDYLRVCGADFCHDWDQVHEVGLSPRVRSGRLHLTVEQALDGIISACAERTCVSGLGFDHGVGGWDYLRVCGADSSTACLLSCAAGLSPRVRSGPIGIQLDGRVEGIISACAERTTCLPADTACLRDYLRVCGADSVSPAITRLPHGLSPRVRSGPAHQPPLQAPGRIISACAERTSGAGSIGAYGWDYLRVCGADDPFDAVMLLQGGLSPRVRSGLVVLLGKLRVGGIISACAERTHLRMKSDCAARDYLRVCGADFWAAATAASISGLSPRVRSGQADQRARQRTRGIISACAERTEMSPSCMNHFGDYLRVCGADISLPPTPVVRWGLSPRVRSGPEATPLPPCLLRIISACAERTWNTTGRSSRTRDYLRVCGADRISVNCSSLALGLSPRVRSGLPPIPRIGSCTGIISACAERTAIDWKANCASGDYLRVCGADATCNRSACLHVGLSPRVRSGPRVTSPKPE